MRSAASAAIWAQTVLIVKSRDGSRPRPVSLATRIRSSTRAWARWRASRIAELSGGGVGGERLVPVAVGSLEQGESGAGVGLLAAHDQPHPGRPLRQVHQPGDLHDAGMVAGLAVGVERGLPRRLGHLGDGVVDRDPFVHREPDRVLDLTATDSALLGQPAEQLVGGAGGVGPDQQVRDGNGGGIWAIASVRTVMWSPAWLAFALPGRSRTASISPVLSHHAPSGWNPNPPLKFAAACSFSECAVTNVASTSITTVAPEVGAGDRGGGQPAGAAGTRPCRGPWPGPCRSGPAQPE